MLAEGKVERGEKEEITVFFTVPFDLEEKNQQQLLKTIQTLYHSMILARLSSLLTSAHHDVSYSRVISAIPAIGYLSYSSY